MHSMRQLLSIFVAEKTFKAIILQACLIPFCVRSNFGFLFLKDIRCIVAVVERKENMYYYPLTVDGKDMINFALQLET